jgi:KDO2-lipid IV(A) lauroyltransferase
VGLVVAILAALPRPLLLAVARGLASLAWLLGVRRRVALDNLALAFPEKPEGERRAIARQVFTGMAEELAEALAGTRRELADEQWLKLAPLLEGRQAVLIAVAHYGSWEVCSEELARRGFRPNVVVKRLRGSLNAAIVERRKESGLKLIEGRGVVKESLAALSRGEPVAMMIDQSQPKESAIWVPFFGRPAATNSALSVVARRSGAPVYLALCHRTEGKLEIVVDGPFPVPDTGSVKGDVAEHTAALQRALEGWIRRRPEQWLWLHRRWKVPPPKAEAAA